MSGDLVFLIFPDAEFVESLSKALHASGLKVLSMRSEAEAEQVIATFKYVLPDVLITPLDAPDSNDNILIKLLNANPLMEQVPVVVLASGDQDQRRRALRQGLTDLIFPPYEFEEVILTTRLALERDRNKRPMFGSISQLSVPDLLQTVEVGRRSGTIVLSRRGAKGTIWFRDGIIVDGEIDDGRTGEAAVYGMAMWSEGTFEADFNPIAVPERISLVPSVMLLEAMQRFDEETRAFKERPRERTRPAVEPTSDDATTEQAKVKSPPARAGDGSRTLRQAPGARTESPRTTPIPTEVPTPLKLPGDAVTVHLALTLLNIAASYALRFLTPKLLHRRLELIKEKFEHRYPELRIFQVTPDGMVAIAFDVTVVLKPEEIAAATSEWLLEFISVMERTMPRRFTVERFAELTRPLHEEMKKQGFYRELGFDAASRRL